MSEMEDFEKVFKVVIEFVKKDKNMLVVVMVDYVIGGLFLGVNGEYNFKVELIKVVKCILDFMVNEIVKGVNVEEILKKYIDL